MRGSVRIGPDARWLIAQGVDEVWIAGVALAALDCFRHDKRNAVRRTGKPDFQISKRTLSYGGERRANIVFEIAWSGQEV